MKLFTIGISIWEKAKITTGFRNSSRYQNFRNIQRILHVTRQRLQYLHKLLQDFRMKTLALINKDRGFFQYNSEDLVYIIPPLTSQLRTASRKVAIKYIDPLVVYKIVDPFNYLIMTLDGKLLRGTI